MIYHSVANNQLHRTAPTTPLQIYRHEPFNLLSLSNNPRKRPNTSPADAPSLSPQHQQAMQPQNRKQKTHRFSIEGETESDFHLQIPSNNRFKPNCCSIQLHLPLESSLHHTRAPFRQLQSSIQVALSASTVAAPLQYLRVSRWL